MNIREHPVISINNHTFYGALTGPDLAQGLCTSFKQRPDFCVKETFDTLVGNTAEYTKVTYEDDTPKLLFVGLVAAACNILFICYHKTTSKKQR